MARKVIIIGAGFAGLVAARELQTLGHTTEIFEARNRIGGRAWTDNRLGVPLEMGATWVHWMQPNIWNEITRYGQTIYPSPYTEKAYWVTENRVISGTEAEIDEKISRPMYKIFENSKEFFPNPHDPLKILDPGFPDHDNLREKFRTADHTSPLDLLRTGEFTQEEIDLCDAYWSAGFIGDPDRGSSLMPKQWAALSHHNLPLMDDITLRWKLTNGMRGLYENIAQDLTCPIHLSTPITRVEHHKSGVTVFLETGESHRADAVIITVPVGALGHIDFTPALPAPMNTVIEEKWNSTGCKAWIKVKGHHNIFAYAPRPAKLTMIRSELFLDDNTTILVGFGPQHEAMDVTNLHDAQEAINRWRPDLEVLDCTGHDWVADKWSGQAWATLRKGQFIEGWSAFANTSTRLYFAGSDYAKGWRGVVVEGALETGVATARRVHNELSATDS
ncbi:flavin monoamine oxidase family protein [Rothia nasisuis]|uniref:flavin monoamine oxidase family protein n=1 Tax=Rothia nasisuis TaxID=2109647 RepID=UPI001F1E96F5|nr:NAD(P)/FAD-dependent oxidoreductase [Rothia nasisuis]